MHLYIIIKNTCNLVVYYFVNFFTLNIESYIFEIINQQMFAWYSCEIKQRNSKYLM